MATEQKNELVPVQSEVEVVDPSDNPAMNAYHSRSSSHLKQIQGVNFSEQTKLQQRGEGGFEYIGYKVSIVKGLCGIRRTTFKGRKRVTTCNVTRKVNIELIAIGADLIGIIQGVGIYP